MNVDQSHEEPKTRLNYLLLESSELFAGIPSSIQMEVMDSATTRCYVRGETIFFTGDRIKKVLLLVEGCVKLTQITERGDEVILRLHRPGEVVGMPDWVPGEFHSYTAQALQTCRVLAWNAKTIQSAKERFPQLQRNASNIIERAITDLQRRLCATTTGDVRSRLALGVAQSLEEIGKKVNSHIEICLSQEELGQMTAVSPCEVCRELKKWERQGLVRLRREVIEVQNVPGLLGLCKAN
jgi:CRP/FNR family transcriptional regulator, nitrogen oxide reductase regulator